LLLGNSDFDNVLVCRSRKKKSAEVDVPEEFNNASLPMGDSMDGEMMRLPNSEENSESDPKNEIGAAGITAAEGGSSAPISGGEGDTSTQDSTLASDATASVAAIAELATPEKPKKAKKPKLKSSSTGKKRPSKYAFNRVCTIFLFNRMQTSCNRIFIFILRTLLAFKNRKKRKRSDSEGSEPDRTPPPSPPPEDDSSVSIYCN
jgi:hypothetical protein